MHQGKNLVTPKLKKLREFHPKFSLSLVVGRWWPLPLPSYRCNPANALGLSIEEKDRLFCTGIGAGGLCLCPPTYAIGLSIEENDLLQMAH